MQTRNPFLDEFSKLATGALGVAQAAGEEVKTAWRAQAERFIADMDLVRRDEHDALKAEVDALRAELETLKAGDGPARKTPEKRASTARARPKDAAG